MSAIGGAASAAIGEWPAVSQLQDLRDILRAGILAPSAENRHYLRFEIGTDRVRLWSTDEATWAEQPHRRMLDLMSYGAVVRNMQLCSQRCGHVQHTEWLPDPARPALIAECRWTASPPREDPLALVLAERHTNRRLYRREPVDDATLRRMREAAAIDQAELIWLADPRARAAALLAMRIAESERFRRHLLHAELFRAIAFDAGWHGTTREGLPPGSLEVEMPARGPFAALRGWPLMRAASWLGLHHALGLRAAWLPARMSAQIGLVVCAQADASLAALNAGRALESAWLAATVAGLALQPMAAATVLVRQRPGHGWVSAKAQQRIVQALRIAAHGRPIEHTFMLLRVGHAKPPTVVTQRHVIDDYLLG